MNPLETLSLAERITLPLEGLCRAVAARIAGGAMEAAIILLVWTRVRRAQGRIKALLVRFRAGRLRQRAVQTAERGMVRATRLVSDRPALRLPRRFGWLLPMVPYEAANFASQLRVQLEDPEMQALLAASGQVRRILAPVCRMLAIEPEVLAVAAASPCDPGFVCVTLDGDEPAPEGLTEVSAEGGERAGTLVQPVCRGPPYVWWGSG